jgi:hypothetical protein
MAPVLMGAVVPGWIHRFLEAGFLVPGPIGLTRPVELSLEGIPDLLSKTVFGPRMALDRDSGSVTAK